MLLLELASEWLGSGVFVGVLWVYFWLRYFASRLEAKDVDVATTLEREGPLATIASMERLRKLRDTRRGRVRPAFKQLARRLATLDLRRHVSGGGTPPASPTARSLPRRGSGRAAGDPSSLWGLRPAEDEHSVLAAELPGAVRHKQLFRALCDAAERVTLAAGETIQISRRGETPSLAVAVVLDGSVEVRTADDSGASSELPPLCRCHAGRNGRVSSLLTTLYALTAQPAPLSVQAAAVGSAPAELLVLRTAAYAPLALRQPVFVSATARTTLARLDGGLLQMASYLGLGPALLQAPSAPSPTSFPFRADSTRPALLDSARSVVAEALGVPLAELPQAIQLAADDERNEREESAVLCVRSVGRRWVRPRSSLQVLLSGEVELHSGRLDAADDSDESSPAPHVVAADGLSVSTHGEVLGLLTALSGLSSEARRLMRSRGEAPCWVVEVPQPVFQTLVMDSPRASQRVLAAVSRDCACARMAALGWRLDYAIRYDSIKARSVLLRQGAAADGLHVVMSGRLRSTATQQEGTTDHHDFMRGDSIGEMEAIMEDYRRTSTEDEAARTYRMASTVTAVRDSLLAHLPAALFKDIATSHPIVLQHICRNMARQLLARRGRNSEPRGGQPDAPDWSDGLEGVKTIAVLPAGGEGCSHDVLAHFCSTLSVAVNAIVSCQVIDSSAVTVAFGLSEQHAEVALLGWLAEQEESCTITIYQADTAATPWSHRCVRQADLIIRLGLANPSSSLQGPGTVDASVGEVEAALLSDTIARQELVLLHVDPPKGYRPTHTRDWLTPREPDLKTHHHVRLHTKGRPSRSGGASVRAWDASARRSSLEWDRHDIRSDFHRLARHYCRVSIGLCLGGGGARGMAHLATIQALEEQGIPIDVVGGTSIGAFMGALYAEQQDWRLTQWRAATISSVMGSTVGYIKDLTCPLVSFFSGRGMNNGLRQIFGAGSRIEDLWLPYYCITSNVSDYREEVHRRGILWRFVRASMSLQGYLPPLCHPDEDTGKVQLLMDGGYLNNLPADVMRRFGVGTVIAVEVAGSWTASYDDYGDDLSGCWLALQRIKATLCGARAPRIMGGGEISSQLAYMMAAERMRTTKEDIDLFLAPPVQDFGLLDFQHADTIMKLGYGYSVEKLSEWREGLRRAGGGHAVLSEYLDRKRRTKNEREDVGRGQAKARRRRRRVRTVGGTP